MLPRRFLLDGQPESGAVAIDLLTHPDYRGKKLAARLVREAMTAPVVRAFSVVVGFSNPVALPTHRAEGGWTELGPFQIASNTPSRAARLASAAGRRASQLARPAAARRLFVAATRKTIFSFAGKPPAASTGAGLSLNVPSESRIAWFWTELARRDGLQPVRDYAWHLWRFHQSPQPDHRVLYLERDGMLRGYVAVCERELVVGHRDVKVVDCAGIDPTTTRQLFEQVLQYARCRLAASLTFPRIGPAPRPIWAQGEDRPSDSFVLVRSPNGRVTGPRMTELVLMQSDSDLS
jgi:hypothetical protein